MMKRMITTVVACLIAVFGHVEAYAAGVPVRVGFQPGTAPRFLVARDEHMLEKVGLAPEYSKFISGPTMLAALQGENIDVAFMTTAPVIFALAQGIDIRVFLVESDASGTQALVSTKRGSIKSLADQKGKAIAVTFGTSAHYAMLKSLEAAKISDSDLSILDMQPSAMLPAFIKDDIDGAWSWDPWTAKMQSEGGTLVGSLASLHLPMAGVWVARSKWLVTNSEATQLFIKAMDVTAAYIDTHRSEAVNAIARELGLDEHTAEVVYGRIEVPQLTRQIDGYIAALGTSKSKADAGMSRHMNDLAEFFFRQKRIPARPDVVGAIDPRPLEEYLHLQ